MPAASTKTEKPQQQQANPTSAATSINGETNDSSLTALKQVLVLVEHKIRNLEKRKAKLETYREIEKSGKELSADRKTAILKYGEVIEVLDCTRDISKQVSQISVNLDKELKKKQKKDETARKLAENAKIRDALMILETLSLLVKNEEIREDFTHGTNGACQLNESDFVALDKLLKDLTPKRPMICEDLPFKYAAQRSAEHLSSVIEGKKKEYGDSTYFDLRVTFERIQDSGYFDKGRSHLTELEATNTEPDDMKAEHDNLSDNNGDTVKSDNINEVNTGNDIRQQQPQPGTTSVSGNTISHSASSMENKAIGSNVENDTVKIEFPVASTSIITPPNLQQKQPLIPTTNLPQQPPSTLASSHQPYQQLQHQQHIPIQSLTSPSISHPHLQKIPAVKPTIKSSPTLSSSSVGNTQTSQLNPSAVLHQTGAVQQQSAAIPPTTNTLHAVEQVFFKQTQYVPQIRPLAEVIGPGAFYFLQDSELDLPDVPTEPQMSPNVTNTLAPSTQLQQKSQSISQQQQQQQIQHDVSKSSPTQLLSQKLSQQMLSSQPLSKSSAQQLPQHLQQQPHHLQQQLNLRPINPVQQQQQQPQQPNEPPPQPTSQHNHVTQQPQQHLLNTNANQNANMMLPQPSQLTCTPPPTASQPTPSVVQHQSQQQQQQQLQMSTQAPAFNNTTFPNIVPTPIFTNLKTGDIPTQHIPGFAAPNAPIPLPTLLQTMHTQQSQQSHQQHQPSHQQQQQSSPQQQHQLQHTQQQQLTLQQQAANIAAHVIGTCSPPPAMGSNLSMSSYPTPADSSHRNYRSGNNVSGNGGGVGSGGGTGPGSGVNYNRLRNIAGTGRTSAGSGISGNSINNTSGNLPNNGFRNRPSSYQQNNRQSANNTSNNTGTSTGTFFKNNDTSYYQNGNGYRGNFRQRDTNNNHGNGNGMSTVGTGGLSGNKNGENTAQTRGNNTSRTSQLNNPINTNMNGNNSSLTGGDHKMQQHRQGQIQGGGGSSSTSSSAAQQNTMSINQQQQQLNSNNNLNNRNNLRPTNRGGGNDGTNANVVNTANYNIGNNNNNGSSSSIICSNGGNGNVAIGVGNASNAIIATVRS